MKKFSFLFLIFNLFFLSLVSCGFSSNSSLTGNIVIDGSSTVYPMTEIIAEEFTMENSNVKILIGESGTGGGMKKFIDGDIDILNASREIKQSELERAIENNISLSLLTVANDGIAVVVNSENDFATNLTKEELSHIFRQNNPAKYWSDVREGFPNELIKVYTPGAASGTFEFFTEKVNGELKSQREDAILSEDDNILVKGVSEDKYSIGYFGYSYYKTNKDKFNIVSIDGVEPTSETINTYMLSRPLYVYFDANDLDREEIREFIKFYLTNAYYLAGEVQLEPLNDEDYKKQLDNLNL